MTKKRFIAITVLALGAPALAKSPLIASEGASEQGAKTEGPGPSEKGHAFASGSAGIEWLERELKLTDAQKAQLRGLDQDLEQQANDIRQNNLLSPEDKEARMHALHEGLATRIKAVLTSDQIQKFDQMGGLKAMMSRPRGAEGIVVLKENGFDRLGLTEAQKSAIEKVMAEDKAGFVAAGGDVVKLRVLKQAAWQRIMAVLTPEQQQKLAAGKGLELEYGPDREMRMPELGSLGLAPDRQSRLEAILKQAAPRAHAIQEDRSLSEPQRVAQMTSLYQELRPQLLSFLTPAQEQKLRGLLLDPRR